MRNFQTEAVVKMPGQPLIEAHLAGLMLTSPDVRQLSDFYSEALGYVGAWKDEAWSGTVGGSWLAIRQGAANAIDHAVFAVAGEAQLAALRVRLAAARIAHEDVEAPNMRGGALAVSDPDGNHLVFGVPETESEKTAPAPELVARLQHLVYASDGVAAMLRFYCDVIGFAPTDYVLDEAEDLTSVFLRCSDEHHSLAVFRAQNKRLDHFCYDVDDWSQIRDWADRFAERRIPLRWGPGRHGPGNNLFLFVNDPDGNWLEFSAELERVEQARPTGQWVHEERTLNSWGSAFLRS